MTATKKILVSPAAGPPPGDFTGNFLFNQLDAAPSLGGVAVDSATGDIYTAGYFKYSSSAVGKPCLHKFASDLTLTDSFIYTDANTVFQVIGEHKVAVNANGVYVFGSARTATTAYSLVTKHNKSTLAIDAHFDGIQVSGSVSRAGLLAADGSVYVAIDQSSNQNGSAYSVLIKLSADLNTIIWRKKLFDQALSGTTIQDMIFDSNGDIVVCGMAGFDVAFIGRFSATDGTFTAYNRYDYSTSQTVVANALLDIGGQIYLLTEPFSILAKVNFDLSGFSLIKGNYWAGANVHRMVQANGNIYCVGWSTYNPNRRSAIVWSVDPVTLLSDSNNAVVIYDDPNTNSDFYGIADLGDGRFVCVGSLGHANSGSRDCDQLICCFNYDITTLVNSGVCNTKILVADDLNWDSGDRVFTDKAITLTVSDDTTILNTGNPIETTETYTTSGPCSWDGT